MRKDISIIPKQHPTPLLLPKPLLSPPQQPGLRVIVLGLILAVRVIAEYLVILRNILLGVQFH